MHVGVMGAVISWCIGVLLPLGAGTGGGHVIAVAVSALCGMGAIFSGRDCILGAVCTLGAVLGCGMLTCAMRTCALGLAALGGVSQGLALCAL